MKQRTQIRRFRATFLTALLALSLSSCATTSAFRDLAMTDAKPITDAAVLESGKIFFFPEQGFFEKLFAKKEALPETQAQDIVISGKRTGSTPPKKLESDSKLLNVLDALLRENAWSYDWKGKALVDGVKIPLVLHMKATEGSLGKNYRLSSCYSRSHGKAVGAKERLKKLAGTDHSAKLSMEKRINSESCNAPFELARLTAKDGSEYQVQAVRTFSAEAEEAPKPTVRSLIFSRAQQYEFSDSTGSTVASCTLDSFTLYAARDEQKSADRFALKECIALFISCLWSLDEHESTSDMLE